METLHQTLMTSSQGEAVPLKEVSVIARLLDLLAIVEVSQTYRNEGTSDIEAVYTFPLPPGASLLDLELAIGERKLRGKVIEKQEAAVRYEQAIEAGHSALMLEECGDGLYTLNLGHLRAGEEAVVRFRYGLIGRWNGDEYSFRLPTALAPRYGDPASAGLSPHQAPTHSLKVAYAFSLRVEAFGRLRQAVIRCPSHAIAREETEDRVIVTLSSPASLDRDLVLSFRVAGDIPAFACHAPDGERFCAWASFRPQFAASNETKAARSLRLVIDCSGSMQGDSIAQARAALLEILDRLLPEDRFNITAFGSNHKSLFNQEAGANSINLAIARTWARRLQADMGGTELASAVEAACALPAELAERDVLLVTDGEVWDDGRIAKAAGQGNWRVFAVGVGSAPAEAVLRSSVEATGGACEMVAPGEDMSRRIVRHFERLREPQAQGIIAWPAKTEWPRADAVLRCFPGDTVNAFAVLETEPLGEARLTCTKTEGEQIYAAKMTTAPAEIATDLPRLVAAHWLKHVRPQQASAIALRYQLVSPYTNYLVVMERTAEEAGDGMPELQVVPQMLAAGWGGAGSVDYSMSISMNCPEPFRRERPSLLKFRQNLFQFLSFTRHLTHAGKLHKALVDIPPTPKHFLHALGQMCLSEGHPFDIRFIRTNVLRAKAPTELLHLIDELAAEEQDERWLWLIVAWLLVATTPIGKNAGEDLRTLLDATSAIAPVAQIAVDRLAELLGNATVGDWDLLDDSAVKRIVSSRQTTSAS